MAYTFKSLFLNEMKGLVFPCVGHDVVPAGPPGFTNSTYQGCAMAGYKEVASPPYYSLNSKLKYREDLLKCWEPIT